MKKTLTLLLLISVFFACTKDETTKDFNNTTLTTIDFSKDLNIYDASNEGLYKGVFTTNDSEMRGTLILKIKENKSLAKLSLINGKVISFVGSQSNDQSNEDVIYFTGSSFTAGSNSSFKFAVESNGDNPVITEALYNNIESTFLIAKETSFGPVNPMTGSISCFDCDNTHPSMDTGNTGTFNLLFAVDGSGNETVTVTVDVGAMVTLTGSQNNCTGLGTITCDLAGSDVIVGNNGSNTINWSGTHSYTALGSCSEGSGTWTLSSTVNGNSNGTWISDAVCENDALVLDANNSQYAKYTSTSGDILDTKLNGATDYTMELWVKPTAADFNGNRLVNRWNQSAIILWSSNRFYFARYGGTGGNRFVNSSTNAIIPNEWNHIAVICNSTDNTIKLYVNGVDVTSSTYTAADVVLASNPTDSHLYLGWGGGTSSNKYFTGPMDKVRIQNRAENIADLNTTDVNGTPYTADAYTAVLYNFNEGSGITTKNEADSNNSNLNCSGGCTGSETWWANL